MTESSPYGIIKNMRPNPFPAEGESRINWHRLFGVALLDFFTGTPFVVELEKDLSLKRQFLDVVILRKEPGEFAGRLPDGLENLADHNLLSYKSLREALDDWALDELIGHYVNYRKQVSPSVEELLPAEQFRLFGVSTRFPERLSQQVNLAELWAGVYEVVWGTHRVRVLVLSQMPEGEQNALWNLFSGIQAKVASGAAQYRHRGGDVSSILNQLFEYYQLEGIVMPYTMEDFRRDYFREHLDQFLGLLTPEEVMQRFSAEERLRGLPAEEVLQRFSPEQIQAYLDRQKKQRKQ